MFPLDNETGAMLIEVKFYNNIQAGQKQISFCPVVKTAFMNR